MCVFWYKWNHTICACFGNWLFSMFLSFTYVVVWISTSFLLWINNTPLYEQTTFCLSAHQLRDIWVVSCFGLSWITCMFKLLMWTYVCISLKLWNLSEWNCWILWWICLTFWGFAKLFFKVAAPFCSFTGSIWEFHCVYILPNLFSAVLF